MAYNPKLKYPITSDGFAECLNSDNPTKILEYMQIYNIVVIDALSQEECEISINQAWEEMNLHGNGKLDKTDPTTWINENWPLPNHIYLSDHPTSTYQSLKNMVNSNIVKTFEILFEHKNICPDVGIISIKRPVIVNGTHMPDCGYDIGSFACVPGSANAVKSNPNLWLNVDQGKYIQTGKESGFLHSNIQKIPLKAGSMVIWDRSVAHANFTNNSDKPRITHFFTYVEATTAAMALNKKNIITYCKENPKFLAELKKYNWANKEKQLFGIKI